MSRFGVGIDISLLVHPPDALESADVESVLWTEIARMSGLYLTTGLIIEFLTFQRLDLRLCENDAVLSYKRLQGLEALFEVGQIMAQPDAAYSARRYENAFLAEFIGDPNLTVGGLLRGVLDYGFLYMGFYTILGVGDSAVLLEQGIDYTFIKTDNPHSFKSRCQI